MKATASGSRQNDSLGESTATTPHSRDITQLSRRGGERASESMRAGIVITNSDFSILTIEKSMKPASKLISQ